MGKNSLKQLTLVLAMTMLCNSMVYAVPAPAQAPASREQVEQRLEEMDNKIVEIMGQLDANKKQISQNEKDILSAEKQLNEAQDKLDNENNLYKDRIRAMYINGSGDYITLIFKAKGLGDFLSRIEMVEKIIDSNKKVTDELIKSQNEINTRKKTLDSKKESLLSLKKDNEKKLQSLNKNKEDELQLLAEFKNTDKLYAANNDKAYNETLNQIQQIRKSAPKVSASRGTLAVSSNYIIAYATNFLGTKYVWGGSTPVPGFDCSGFTQYVFRHFGISLDRTTYGQINDGPSVSRDQLQPGDLVFFGTASDPHHVGIYIGNGQYIHAPHTGDVVKISSMGRSDFLTGIRVMR